MTYIIGSTEGLAAFSHWAGVQLFTVKIHQLKNASVLGEVFFIDCKLKNSRRKLQDGPILDALSAGV